MRTRVLKIIYLIFIFFLVRYLLYDLNILKVTTIEYKNSRINLKHIKKIDLVTKNNKFFLIEPSFITVYNNLNLNFLLNLFEPKMIVIATKEVLILFYSVNSKEYNMFSSSLKSLNSIKNTKECKIYKDNHINSYLIYDKNGVFILKGKSLEVIAQQLCSR